MGRRRRAQKKVNTKKKNAIAKVFKCPFCAHDDAVSCNMDTARGLGTLDCQVCGAKYQATINYLSEPIDLFYEWVDECEANEAKGASATVDRGGEVSAVGGRYDDDDFDEDDNPRRRAGAAVRRDDDDDDDEDDDFRTASKQPRNRLRAAASDDEDDDDM